MLLTHNNKSVIILEEQCLILSFMKMRMERATQKTPRREIEKAIKEIDDFKRRHKTDEHMERI